MQELETLPDGKKKVFFIRGEIHFNKKNNRWYAQPKGKCPCAIKAPTEEEQKGDGLVRVVSPTSGFFKTPKEQGKMGISSKTLVPQGATSGRTYAIGVPKWAYDLVTEIAKTGHKHRSDVLADFIKKGCAEALK